MWEILHGKPVPYEEDSLNFKIQVYNGLRPHISKNTARCYADLMRKCWHTEPDKRPTAAEICDIFAEWQNSENILSEWYESDIKNAYFNVPGLDVDYIIHDKTKFKKFKKTLFKYNIKWTPFIRLSNIETIGKHGFNTVYRAILLDCEHGKQYYSYSEYDDDHADYIKYDIMHESSKIVALKTISLNEFESHMKCIRKYSTLEVYGLTLKPETEEYMMVFQYA
ncbi:hypothetical protein C2G38_1443002, partial [Gigaspora rosea]